MPRLAHSPFVTHIPVGVQCSLIPPASFVNGISSPSGKTPYYDLAASTLPDLAIEMTKTRSTGKNLPKCRHSGDMSDMSACDSMYNVCIFMSSTERVGIDLDGRRYFLASAAAADFGFTGPYCPARAPGKNQRPSNRKEVVRRTGVPPRVFENARRPFPSCQPQLRSARTHVRGADRSPHAHARASHHARLVSAERGVGTPPVRVPRLPTRVARACDHSLNWRCLCRVQPDGRVNDCFARAIAIRRRVGRHIDL